MIKKTLHPVIWIPGVLVVGALVVGGPLLTLAQTPSRPVRRAARPKFSSDAGSDVFFANALKEGLRGKRPEHLGKKAAGAEVADTGNGGAEGTLARGGWSGLISAETIQDAVKSAKMELDRIITQPAAFASGGNRAARLQFVSLTALFAIIAEYDGDVRWKDDAIAARERCRNAAGVCKVGSVQAFNAAKSAKDEIADLIGGNRMVGGGEATPNAWQDLTDRSSLMQKLEALNDDVIQPGVSNDANLQSQSSEILAAVELSAAISEILMKDGMDDAGDEDYDGYCRQIQQAAKDIANALKQRNGSAARSASGSISKACSECHESYRG